jgi:hypothetical protein
MNAVCEIRNVCNTAITLSLSESKTCLKECLTDMPEDKMSDSDISIILTASYHKTLDILHSNLQKNSQFMLPMSQTQPIVTAGT